MSAIDSLRRTSLKVLLNNVDISEDVNNHLLSLTFTDVEDGSSDDLEIQLEDRDNSIIGKWLNTELDKRGKTTSKAGNSGGKCPYKEPSKTLKKGSKGEGVKWLQWHLNTVNGAGLSINGNFEKKTKNAVLSFQKKQKMTKSGTVNKDMRKKLKSLVKTVSPSTAGKKASLTARITQKNWDSNGRNAVLNCGTFELDSVTMKGPPQIVTMKGTACSYQSGIRNQKRTKVWQNTTLQAIHKSIANACGFTALYLPNVTVKYTRKNQRNQTYISFLQELCKAAGLSMKTTDGTLVIFDQKTKEDAKSVRTIKRGDGTYTSYNFDTKLSNTAYSACHVKYKKTNGKEIEYTYVPPGGKKDKDNILEVSSEKVDTTAEAKTLAIAKLRAANKGETTGSFTMPGDASLCAGLTVQVKGFGAFDGKYIIEESRHTISKSQGYKTSVKIRKVITGY